jgi:hypothetical protein
MFDVSCLEERNYISEKVTMKMFGPKVDEVSGKFRESNDELRDLRIQVNCIAKVVK